MVEINYLAVLVAAVVNMVIGSLWYGPIFGKKWIALMGFSQQSMAEAKSRGMWKAYLTAFIGSFLMAYVLSHLVVFSESYFNRAGASVGLTTGFWNWLGFIVPVTLGAVIWAGGMSRKAWRLWFLENGYYLITLMVMGVILAVWK